MLPARTAAVQGERMALGNDYRVYAMNASERRRTAAAAAAAGAGISLLFYDSLLPAAAVIILYRPIVKWISGIIARSRRKKLRVQLRDLLFCISASFATGRHMTESLIEAEPSLAGIYGEEGIIVGETREMIRAIREEGKSETDVLKDFARRSGLDEADEFVRVYEACRESGGDMVGAVDRCAAVIGEEIEIDEEIRTELAQRKYEGRLITAMPAVILLFLRITSADYIAVMYDTWAGRILMTAALAVTAATLWITERITDIDI